MTVKNESKTYIYKINTGVAFEYVVPFYYDEGKTEATVYNFAGNRVRPIIIIPID